MAKLTLTSLTCVRKNDVTGKDEPVLSVNGREVWRGVAEKGKNVTVGETVNFSGTAQVKLEEADNNGDNAKQIGSVLSINAKGGNPERGLFKNSGTHYELFYKLQD